MSMISVNGYLRGVLKNRIAATKRTIANKQKRLKAFEKELAKLTKKK